MKPLFNRKSGPELHGNDPTRFFVHIPKTAGTSFRTAVESRFGRSRVLRDYGLDSAATSQSVKEEVYLKKDNAGIERAISIDNAVLVAGHVPITKYGSHIGLKNTIAIFRDPVEQVISHYRHVVRDQDYQGDLISFAQLERNKNIQSRLMTSIDPALLGIVGLTESYRETLAVANHHWGWNLKHKRKNVSRELGFNSSSVSEETKAELKRLNQADHMLYERACFVFANTQSCMEQKTETDLRAAITHADSEIGVRGWAFDVLSDRPAEIEVRVNHVAMGKAICMQPVAEFVSSQFPRNGLIGFSLKEDLRSGDFVEIRNIESDCCLAYHVVADSG